MKELNLQQLENLEGGKRKFWGQSCGDAWYIGDQCFQTCNNYALWINLTPGGYIQGC